MRSAQSRYRTFGAVAILGLAFILSLLSAVGESQTYDEAVHLSAGMSYWKTGDFRLNPEHPPLLKYLAALPLLPFSPSVPTDHTSWNEKDQWTLSRVFLYENRLSPDFLLLLGRLPTLLLTAALGFTVWWWSRRLFGGWAALISVSVFALHPLALAHGHYITTDMGVSFGFLASVIAFRRWYPRRTRTNALILFLCVAYTITSKFSGLFILPILGALAGVRALNARRAQPVRPPQRRTWVRRALWCIALAGAVWAIYAFEIERPWDEAGVQRMYAYRDAVASGSVAPSGITGEHTLLTLLDPDTGHGRWIASTLQRVQVPAFAYIRGLGAVIVHGIHGHTSYLLGMPSKTGGWWYYFPFTLLVKTPLLMLILLALLGVHGVRSWRGNRLMTNASSRGAAANPDPTRWFDLLFPPVLYFLWSMTSNLNLGVRHLLPLIPFLAVAVGWLGTVRWSNRRNLQPALACVIIACSVWIAVSTFPHYLSYRNALFPTQDASWLLLNDSNVDWGQDLKHLRSYLSQNGVAPFFVAYYGQTPLAAYGMNAQPVPTSDDPRSLAPPPGTYAVSISELLSTQDDYRWLTTYQPDTIVGGSILIYTFPKVRTIDQSR